MQQQRIKQNAPKLIVNPASVRIGRTFATALGGTDQGTPPGMDAPEARKGITNTHTPQQIHNIVLNLNNRTNKLEKTIEILASKVETILAQINNLSNLLTR